jgi:probable biosynthetic protein (TIGR04098 family)
MSTFDLELGMPHLGRNNLSESALFKAVGNDRWNQIERVGAVRSSLIRDDVGSRLYATFFFVEVNLPREMPLSYFGENDTIRFTANLTHFSKVYLDGWHSIAGRSEYGVRCSNVFIYQENGPSKLSLAVPVNLDFSGIPELPEKPDSLDFCRRAKASGSFFGTLPEDKPLFDGEREFVYQMDADRDLNGAGLVYFANFISFLDLAERKILSSVQNPMPDSLLDARSTYRRRIGYFGNAKSTDSLSILIRASMHRVRGQSGPGFLDLGLDYRILRSCDNKVIVISSARKVIVLEPGSEGERWVDSCM